MKLAVITLVLSLCLVVSLAYPKPYPWQQTGAQEILAPAAAGYPYVPFDVEGVRTQVGIPTSPQELYECANQNCDSKLKHLQ